MAVLFLTYTGVLEALGKSQVLPYVRGLARRGHKMVLLSFERQSSSSVEADSLRRCLDADGIVWHALRYHKKPAVLSTMLDVARGAIRVSGVVRRGVRMIHARSHVPALLADLSRIWKGTPYLFDHRGLMAEEYADAGIWRRGGLLYRVTEEFERRFVRHSARVVVLTETCRNELAQPAGRVTVIPCAVDLQTFCPPDPSVSRPFDLVYAGAWSGLYLRDETIRFFEAFRRLRPAARMLLLVPASSDVDSVPPSVEIRHPAPEEVPTLLRAARAGVSLRQPGRAQRAASPVKVSEYLASGLPVVSSAGVGDLDALLPRTQTGVITTGFSTEELGDAAKKLSRLLEEGSVTVNRCRRVAEECYGLPGAIEAYDRVYREILQGEAAA